VEYNKISNIKTGFNEKVLKEMHMNF